jgi:hypothetical protein
MGDCGGLVTKEGGEGGSASGGWSDSRRARKPVACTGACGTSILSLPMTEAFYE